MNPNIPKARKLGTKSTHHQTGALSSHSDAMRLEIQPKLRLFATSGIRSSSGGVCGKFAGVARAAISALLSRRRPPHGPADVRLTSPRTPELSTELLCLRAY